MKHTDIHLSRIHVPRRWPRRPLPGHLWRNLVTDSLSVVAVVRAVARVFSDLGPGDLEDSYEAFQVIYNTLRTMRDWHVGESRESEVYQYR